MKKRLLSLLLSLAMLLTLLPGTAIAGDPVDIASLPEFTSTADTSEITEFKISSEASLRDLASAVKADNGNGTYKMSGVTFYLANNIELTGSWTPIGSTVSYPGDAFAGTFDGQYHTISGLSINAASTYQGLFARTNGASIKNLIVEGSINCGTSNYVGGIVGWAQATRIENCSFEGPSVQGGYTGGIVGGLNTTGTTIINCVNRANVTGTTAGGILGYATGNNTIENCYNTGTIAGSTRSGGIAGQLTVGTLKNCYNTGHVGGTASGIGGIYGQSNITVLHCYYLYPETQTPGGNGSGSEKIASPADLLDHLGNAFVSDTDGINGGYPLLYWQTAPDTTPSLGITRTASAINVKPNTAPNHATLTIRKSNMDGLDVSQVDWAIEKKGGGSAADIAILEPVVGDSNSRVVRPVQGGVVTVTASLTADGEPYTASIDITVIPHVTTVDIKNVSQPGAVAMGQTVEAKVNVSGGGEYDYENLPPLTYQWQHRPSGGSVSNIPGATGKTFTIPASYNEWDYIHVEVRSGGALVKSGSDTYQSIRSEDYGKLYPVAYDTDFTLPANVKDGAAIQLPLSHTVGAVTANIEWNSDTPPVIAADGTVTPPESGKTAVTLTGKFTYGSAFANRTFTVTVWSQSAVDEEATGNDAQLQEAADSLGDWYRLYPAHGRDANVAVMVAADLAAKGHGDVSVTVSSAKEVYGGCGIGENGDITYFYADPNSTRGLWFGRYDVAFTLQKGDSSLELPDVPVILYWNVNQVKAAMTSEILDQVTDAAILAAGDSTDSVTANLTLPKVVDNKKWTQVAWTSSDPGAISVSSENQTSADTLFDPYVGRVIRGAEDKTVILTAAFTFQRANDVTGSEPPIVMHKTFTVTVKAIGGDAAEAAWAALLAKLDKGFAEKGLRDYVTGATLTPVGDIYTVSNDIQFPTTHDFGVDGKYYPVTIASSDEETIAAPGVANAARVTVYRPPVGADPKTVTLTVTMADKNSGISASKEFQISVSPLTQAEITAELALMDQVKASYFDGIKSGNPSADNVTSNLRPFQEAYLDNGTLTWVHHVDDRVNHGIVPVALDDWYDLQVWRLFKSSNPAVVSHENLLVTRQANAKAVTVSSALSSEVYGKYGERYQQDPVEYADYAALAPLYYQEVSASLTVRGMSDPGSATPVEEKLTVSFTLQSASGTLISSTTVPNLPEGSTVFDVFTKVLREQGYDYASRGSYVYAVITPDGAVLEELDEGANSGWMYKVNGNIPSSYMAAYPLRSGDNIVVFFTKDYTQETGYPGGGWNQPIRSEHAEVTPKGDGTYSVTLLADAATAAGGVQVSIPNVQSGQTVVVVNADGTETIVKKSMIKNGTAYLVLTQNATVKVVDLTASFSDVKQEAWYSEAVDFVGSRRLFQGTTQESFSPDAPMTRAMLVTVLFRLEDASAAQVPGFTDVGAGAWYADAVGWASENQIVGGHDDGSFAPDQNITRQQLATILFRYASSIELDTSEKAELSSFPDQNRVADYADEALAWAIAAGLIQGRDGALSPEASASRAEVALIFYRLVGLIVQ